MKKINLILFIFMGLFVFACGGDDTGLTFETVAHPFGQASVDGGKEIPADSNSYIEIRAKVTSVEGEVYDGRTVIFTTTNGLFKTDPKESGENKMEVKTKGSVATIRLYPNSINYDDAVIVEATFDDTAYEGESVTKTIKLKFGNLNAGEKLSACHFEVKCVAKNLGAYIDNNIATECFIKTENRKQLPVIVPNIEFKMETGKMVKMEGETSATDRYFYIPDPIKKPKDVEPITISGNFGTSCDKCKDNNDLIERCRCGLQGETLNPRDSLVTIIAYANGEECFEDLNSNEEFDPGEKIYGNFLGEPFVDTNDNAKRDSDEQYVEKFGNPNDYDEEDGAWNDDITVWTQTKVLLTGLPHEFGEETTRFERDNGNNAPTYINWVIGDSVGVKCNESVVYNFYLFDEYLNPIATNPNESSMTITMSGPGITNQYNKSNAELSFNVDKYGFEMDAKGRILKFNLEDEDLGVKYIAKIQHADEENCKDYDGTEAYTVQVSISTTPGISNEKYPLEGEDITNLNKVWEFSGKIHLSNK